MAAEGRAETGRLGEEIVADYLVREGYEIVGRNVRVGRLELDIIARLGSLIVVCEVRSRRRAGTVHPSLTFDRAKRGRVRRAAAAWLAQTRPKRSGVRFDAAAVVLEGPEGAPVIDYYPDAF